MNLKAAPLDMFAFLQPLLRSVDFLCGPGKLLFQKLCIVAMLFAEHFTKCSKSLRFVCATDQVVKRFQPNAGVPEAGQPAGNVAKRGIFLSVKSFRVRTQKTGHCPNAFTTLAHFERPRTRHRVSNFPRAWLFAPRKRTIRVEGWTRIHCPCAPTWRASPHISVP